MQVRLCGVHTTYLFFNEVVLLMSEDNIEHILVKRLLNKEHKAWEEFYHSYSGKLGFVCARYLSEQANIEDVLQEGIIKMYHSIEKFEYRGKGSLQAWASRIVVNEALSFIKGVKKYNTVDEEYLSEDIEEMEEPDLSHVSADIILQLIQELPVGYRTVFNLYVFEEKSHKEIGGLLGIAENSSASQLFRAKQILGRKIKEYKQMNIERYG